MANIVIDGTALLHTRFSLQSNVVNPSQPANITVEGVMQPNPWKRSFLPTGHPLPSDFYANDGIKTFDLPDANYVIISTVHSVVNFTVQNGKIDYPHSLDGIISGRGTNKLMLTGVRITIDARYIIGKGVMFDGTFESFIVGNVLPNDRAIGKFAFTMGSSIVSDFGFDVAIDGTIHFDVAKYGRYAKGDGTKILKLLGYPVLVDGQDTVLFKDGNPVFSMVDNHNMWSATNVIVGNYMPLRNTEIYLLKIDATNRHNGFHLDSNGLVTVSAIFRKDSLNGIQRVFVC